MTENKFNKHMCPFTAKKLKELRGLLDNAITSFETGEGAIGATQLMVFSLTYEKMANELKTEADNFIVNNELDRLFDADFYIVNLGNLDED